MCLVLNKLIKLIYIFKSAVPAKLAIKNYGVKGCLFLIFYWTSNPYFNIISMSKKEVIERERKALWEKDIVVRNPNFTLEEIGAFFQLFNLYADQRRECNILDIVGTAKTLGFDKKHPIVYEALVGIANELDGRWIGFEEFLTTLTQRLVIF